MRVLDVLRQLYLLLWKNVILRRRQKIRLAVEIIWPLFLFLVLVWVRLSTNLKTFQSSCHFPQRPLPSAGLIPFAQGLICHLDYFTCYNKPLSNFYDDNQNFTQLATSVLNLFEFINEPNLANQILPNLTVIASSILNQRYLASMATQRFTLSQILTNEQVVNSVYSSLLNTTPNFNLLYSNLSQPLNLQYNALTSLLLGPYLDRIEDLRASNQVTNVTWLRERACSNDTYLLTGPNQTDISRYLCSNLTNEQLASLFGNISLQMNITDVVQSVLTSTYFANATLQEIIAQLPGIMDQLIESYQQNNLQATISQLSTVWNQINSTSIDKIICGETNASVFTVFRSFQQTLFFNVRSQTFPTVQEDSQAHTRSKRQIPLSNYTSNQLLEFLEQYNRLNNRPTCAVEDTFNRYKNSIVGPIDSSRTTCFCKAFYLSIFSQSSVIRTFFDQVKPMILGKLVYSPNTPAYQELIKRVNATFNNIDQISQLFASVSDILDDSVTQMSMIQQQLDQLNILINAMLNVNLNLQLNMSTLEAASIYLRFFSNSLQCIVLDRFIGYPDEQSAVKATGSSLVWSALIFQNPEKTDPVSNRPILPDIVDYKIRMNSTMVPDTTAVQSRTYTFRPPVFLGCSECQDYLIYGFMFLQDMIEKGVIETKTKSSQVFGLVTQMMPYPCFIDDLFVTAISTSLPLFMVLAWIYTVSMLVKDIVYEKEKRLKEFMRVMGLSNWIHWTSWFITSFSVMFLIGVVMCVVLKYGKLLTYSNVTCLIVFVTCFIIATITQCFLISVIFNRANLAAVAAGVIYFLLYLPYTILFNYQNAITQWQQFLASLSSTVAFGYGCQIIANFETSTEGLTWNTFYATPFSNNTGFTMNFICLLMLMDAAIYLILTWYIEAVFPGEFGIPQRWYFPILPSYWFGPKCTNSLRGSKNDRCSCFDKICCCCSRADIDFDDGQNELGEDFVERIPDELEAGIRIEKLHKVYSRGNNHALKGLSLNFYKNEISSFLGHNGAGKSTTMHLLTGLYYPTSGTAWINDMDINKSMHSIRKQLGFVPQYNVLFDKMTVDEHLWFYGRLKGGSMTRADAKKMLEDTGLTKKKNELAKNLSGGMKRKLSVAIAFAGGSKIVILDEPSAGVDPSGRRDIWDMLFKYRQDRTIVISTHHMDEADILGDRIAIIANGKLIAHGTSQFLKNKYGHGYQLVLSKNFDDESIETQPVDMTEVNLTVDSAITESNKISSSSSTPSLVPSSTSSPDSGIQSTQSTLPIIRETEFNLTTREQRIDDFIKSQLPGARLHSMKGAEMVYRISNKPEDTRTYDQFFTKLESNLDLLGLKSIGLSDSTLEEIFLELAKQPDSNTFSGKRNWFSLANLSVLWEKLVNCQFVNKKTESLTDAEIEEYTKYTKMRVPNKIFLIFQQFIALLIKRFHRVKRNLKGFFAEIVLPVIFICLALLVATLFPPTGNLPALEVHPWYYGWPNRMFVSKSSSYDYDHPVYYPNVQLNINSSVQTNLQQVNQIYSSLFESVGTRCLSNYQIRLTSQAQQYSSVGSDRLLKCNSVSNLDQNYTQPSSSVWQALLAVNYSYTKTAPRLDCATGFPTTQAASSGDIYNRPIYNLKSQDILYDLSGRNISDWVVNSEFTQLMFRKRFGGFEFVKPFVDPSLLPDRLFEQVRQFPATLQTTLNGFGRFNLTSFQSAVSNLFSSNNTNALWANQNIRIWFNNKGSLASVAYMNTINNALLRTSLMRNNSYPNNQGIVLYNHPLPFAQNDLINRLTQSVLIDLFVAICVLFALSLIPASFLVFLVEERQNNSKQLQFVSGVKPYVYWSSNYTWDLINYIVPCMLCILVFLAFNVQSYICTENLPCLIALMLLYGWAVIPLMYPLNYLFKVPSTAFVASSSMNVFVGTITTITVTTLNQLGASDANLLNINSILKPVFMICFPHFCLGQGIIQMAVLYYTAEARRIFGLRATFNPFAFENIGQNLVALAVQGVVFFTFNLLVQYKFFVPSLLFCKRDPIIGTRDEDTQLDEDVLAEKKRILAIEENKKSLEKNNDKDDYIRLVNLTKSYRKLTKFRYKKNVAVNNLCLGIKKGECFGLIGVNGAGKTTSFKMITGEISMSNGEVYIGGHTVSRELEKVHRSIGYCPQSDAIFPLLTAREHLMFYGRLRGIPPQYVKKAAKWAMHRVGLEVFADRISGDFSGGNKRKMSTAIALVGDPTVICLDEPTSGMDAKARRLLWNDILSLIKENRIVLLTSHTMEECEALCTRLVIMVNGKFKCIGSPQHLKQKFGDGFMLRIRLKDESTREILINFMHENFPDAKVQDSHRDLFEYVLPFSTTKLSKLFEKLEKHRDAPLGILDYSINQSTLDQIFIRFAREQKQDAFGKEEKVEIKEKEFTDLVQNAPPAAEHELEAIDEWESTRF